MTPNDVKIVADNIDDFIEVPSGVARLRSAIFALAISGKFAPSGSASWGSSTLGKVCSVRKGKKPELYDIEQSKMLPYLEAKFIRGTKPAKFAKTSDKNSVSVTEDDLIIICDGSNSGEFFTGINGILASTMGVLNYNKEVVSKEYLEVFLESNFELFNKARKGAAIPHLDFDLFNSLEFPLPSIEEQKRIVKRVKEVMKQLDMLEAKKRERDETRTLLARSAMQSLGKGETKVAFGQLSDLVKTPTDIKELESALLSLAVSGKLVPQDKNEGTAEDLYSQIQKELAKDIGGRKKKGRDLTPISKTENLFNIPESWKWVHIGSVGHIRGGKRLPKGTSLSSGKTEHPYIRVTDMKNGSIKTSDIHYISDEVFSKISRYTISSKDIYITIAGTIGDAGKIPGELDGANLTENAAKLEFTHIDQDFLVLVLRSTQTKSQFLEKIVQMAQPKLALHRIESTIIPLPPFAEQKRIVKKVEEVMVLVNHLKQVVNAE